MKRLLKRISFLFLCVSFTQLAFSQTKVVTGTISDDKGAPVQGASVAVKGAKGGTTTDATGAFTLTVSANAKSLVISSVGFNQQEIGIPVDNKVAITLVSSAQSLNDVIVIGYGTTKRKDATGSLTTVSSKEFNQGVITSPDQLLANKVSGLEVTSNSGQPGSATTVRIRGNSSVRGVGNPLYVVDGVILDGRDARPSLNIGPGGFGQTPEDNPLLFIDPNSIADITILKDASSTAIYGSRGANGVIVITTKTGSSGAVRLEANASAGWNTGYMKKFDILPYGTYVNALSKYNPDSTAAKLNHGAHVDPLADITQSNVIQNYDLALSGGNENGKFRASFLASSTPGFIQNNILRKYIGTFSGQYKFIDKRLTINFDLISGNVTNNDVLASNTAGSQGNLISAALQWNPTLNYYNPNGSFVTETNGTPNPLAVIRGYSDISNVQTTLGDISASFKIMKNLEYKFLYSINQSNGTRNANIDGFIQGIPPVTGNGVGYILNAALTSQVIDNTLQYNTTFGQDLKFGALLGFEYWKSNYSGSGLGKQGFNFNQNELTLINAQYTDIIQNGNTYALNPYSGSEITTEIQSEFARVDFNYKDKLYLTGTFRIDGSSKFGANNKYGYFPSAGAKWNIANESFMKDNTLINGLALRGTWGITGSQDFPPGASIDQFAFQAFNSASQVNAGNPDLKWEQTMQYDFGVDFALLNNRLSGSFDYYNKDKTDILFQNIAIQPGPAATYWINLPGHLVNKGIEVSITGNIIAHKDFSWDLTGNFATNSNLITNFYAPGTKTPLAIYTGQINGQGVSGTLGQIITNNQPVDEFYLKTFGGFDQKGNQIVSANPTFAGNPNPGQLFGVSTTLRYKKLTLVINGGGSSGFLIYNNTATSVTNIAGIANGRNIDQNAYNSAEQPSSGVAASNRFLEDGSYFKLRNASLTYSFGNIGNYIKNLNVYVAGSNLFVITGFSGFDPEVNIDKQQGGYPSSSIEYIPYPTPKSVVVGVNFAL
ncbi:MAG TPA: SusC/RagA family TonB-linked outer membrane protein [Puia sp.]|nr:SusC/RagA family TonB-linked outer membrane protein [Puia sp.]